MNGPRIDHRTIADITSLLHHSTNPEGFETSQDMGIRQFIVLQASGMQIARERQINNLHELLFVERLNPLAQQQRLDLRIFVQLPDF